MLVALGSIPRKYLNMADSPKVDLRITTGTVDDGTGKYFITFEAINAVGITSDIFVLTRADDQLNTYSFNRVASLYDIKTLEASPVTEDDSYRASTFTIESVSVLTLKDYKDNLPTVVQNLLDAQATGLEIDLIVGTDETLTLVGESI